MYQYSEQCCDNDDDYRRKDIEEHEAYIRRAEGSKLILPAASVMPLRYIGPLGRSRLWEWQCGERWCWEGGLRKGRYRRRWKGRSWQGYCWNGGLWQGGYGWDGGWRHAQGWDGGWRHAQGWQGWWRGGRTRPGRRWLAAVA